MQHRLPLLLQEPIWGTFPKAQLWYFFTKAKYHNSHNNSFNYKPSTYTFTLQPPVSPFLCGFASRTCDTSNITQTHGAQITAINTVMIYSTCVSEALCVCSVHRDSETQRSPTEQLWLKRVLPSQSWLFIYITLPIFFSPTASKKIHNMK